MKNLPELQDMMAHASIAMQNAYAPYSKFHVGCCIKTDKNKFYTGANVENIAFPASQCAEASAIGMMVVAGERTITDIVVMAKEDVFCPPCGNCLQRLAEFATPDMQVHICSPSKLIKTIPFAGLLPHTFKIDKF